MAGGEDAPMERPETRYADCGGLSIAYQVFGDGPVDLLHAQGWLTNVEYGWESPDWTRFHLGLARFARVITFDKRGMGLSDRDVGAPTLEERAEDILAVLDDCGSARPAILGTSEGGTISAMFAAMHPRRVSSLILYGAFARGSWAPHYPWGDTPEETETLLAALRRNWGKPFDLDDGAPSVAGDAAISRWFATYLRMAASPSAAVAFTRLNRATDVTAALPAISVPTLVLHRDGDRWVDIDEGRYLAERIPGATMRVLPGEDHIPFFGDYGQVVGEIEEFVTGARSAAAPERALLTLVMTDIVGSTEAVAAMGDGRWRGLLEQLDGTVSRRVADHGGRMVKQTGDGFLLSFAGPTKALECAAAIREDARRLGLELRTGVHTGEDRKSVV